MNNADHSQVATKKDVHDLRRELKGDLKKTEKVLREEMLRVEAKVENLEDKFQSLEGKVESLEGKVESLEGKFDSLEDKVERFEDNMTSAITKLQNTLDGFVGTVDELRTETHINTQNIGELGVRVSRLESAPQKQ